MRVRSPGWEDTLEEGMTTRCSILAWRNSMETLNVWRELLLFRALNSGFLCCKQMQCSNNTKYNGALTVLQIVGTCLALCLSSDLKSLSVVTEVSASGASEVSYFQVSI